MAINWPWPPLDPIRTTKELYGLSDILNTRFGELSATLAATSVGGGGAGTPGVTLAKADGGLKGDDSTDDSPALYTLANQTLQPFGGTIYLEPARYRLRSPCFIPGNISICAPRTAMLVVDNTVIAHTGSLTVGLYQFIECVNGGYVEFFTSKSWESAVAFIDGVHPEWFGARGTGALGWHDIDALDLAVKSIRGWPQTPLGTPSWARGKVKLRPGGCYPVNRPWRPFEAAVGGAVGGGGPENTQIMYRNSVSRTQWLAADYPAVNQIAMTDIPAGDLVGKWLLPAGPTHLGWENGTQAREIVEQDGEILRTNGNHGWTDPANRFHILDPCIVDVSGSFNLHTSGFSVTSSGGAFGDGVMSGVFYHRDARRTARGSSRGGFSSVNCDAKCAYANFAIGSFIPGQQNHQEDLAVFWDCVSVGTWFQYAEGSDNQKLWSQRAWRFGSGHFSNPLNYTANGCVGMHCKFGVAISATNLTWDGGTVQSNWRNWAFTNGLQCSVTIRGPRTETQKGFIWSASPQSAYFAVQVEHIEIRGEDLERIPGTGYCKFIEWDMAGSLELNFIRIISPHELAGGYKTLIPAIGPNYIDTGLTLIADEFRGAFLDIHGMSQAGLFGTYEVTGNTTDGRVFIDIEDFATDDTRQRRVPISGVDCYTISAQPALEFNDAKPMMVTANHVGFAGREMGRAMFIRGKVGVTPYTANPNITYDWNNVIPLSVAGTMAVGWEGSRGSGSHSSVQRTVPNDHGVRSDAWQGNGVKPFYHYRGEHQRALVIGAYTLTLGGLTAGGVYVPDPYPGQRLTIELEQDEHGPHPIIWQTGEKAPLRWTPGPPPDGPANSITVCELYFNGTVWLGRWSQYA